MCVCVYPTQGGWTALMWAAYKGRTDVARLLLEKEANPNITGQVLRLDTLYIIISFVVNDSKHNFRATKNVNTTTGPLDLHVQCPPIICFQSCEAP